MLIYDDENEDDDKDNDNDNDNDDDDNDITMKDNNNNNDFDPKLMKKPQHANKNYRCPWELSEKSDICEDCKLDELNKRRDYEKAEIRRLEDDGAPQDCALNMKWANQWRNFVHNKTNIIPGMIDNRHIHSQNNLLKDELIKDADYLMIPSNIWTFLIELYGGGPKIVPINNTKQIRPNRPTKQAPNTPKQSTKQSPSKSQSQSQSHSQSVSPPNVKNGQR
eukprot:CAMPEP_0201596186 /NCGR_PEP_ID=MMETSP0190_2-20130828/192947_1 /ASSEMBLY_ACC=CAM_ASM_000263 /TAXON_ID=37353 /ORGANISM="Rosalina sp." /LENGTH=220 /DNA_ID=CAMNT_0048056441 /DNA_START=1935 /DNA_END=2597 /DNA_ORIENTATION=-